MGDIVAECQHVLTFISAAKIQIHVKVNFCCQAIQAIWCLSHNILWLCAPENSELRTTYRKRQATTNISLLYLLSKFDNGIIFL